MSDGFMDFIPTWKQICDVLAGSKNALKLGLELVCDVKDLQTAKMIVEPMGKLKISKCTVRLSETHVPELELIARRAVLHATGHIPAIRDPFRFLDLPAELRQHILSFTDLVMPFREVEWSPACGYYVENRLQSKSEACSYNDFCSHDNTVYPPCACFKAPLPYFLVCRAVLQDTRLIFFSSNRFIVPSRPYDFQQPQSYRKEQFEASVFLTKTVPRDGLAHLKDLEIFFSSTQYSFLGIEPSVLRDWELTIQLIARHLKKLSLTLYVGGEMYAFPDPIFTRDVPAAQKALFEVHEKIVSPFRQLRCLNGFFVWAWESFEKSSSTRTEAEQTLDKHQEHLETIVMGSGYDSIVKGKMQRKHSRWLMQTYVY
ncbi:hypothetical protein K431DRAFT_348044 [Polychaeton citri CBS 116435]|uniref:Uncharacterized protein n=1 Tax=Polychaeton citri CBS 116435 TaxID=1314669 RepID=A0A9P4UNQ9_9PEZI|nr:hypothetical protein K431DRAFT_348044 [Polychaeton citri CBS 116435]